MESGLAADAEFPLLEHFSSFKSLLLMIQFPPWSVLGCVGEQDGKYKESKGIV